MNKTIKCCLAFLIPAIFFISNTFSQEIDSLTIRHIFSYALTHTQGYETLRRLCKDMPGRLDGSEAAEKAEKFIYDILINLAADSVYRQKVTVPCWNPGNIAEAKIISSGKVTTAISVCAMGPSIQQRLSPPCSRRCSVSCLRTSGMGSSWPSERAYFFLRANDGNS